MHKQDSCPVRSPFYEVWDSASLTALILSLRKKINPKSITALPIMSNYVAVLLQYASVASWDWAETDDFILPENVSCIQRQTWIASSFTINLQTLPDGNYHNYFLKIVPNTESLLKLKWVLQVLNKLFLKYLFGFAIDSKWQKNGTL